MKVTAFTLVLLSLLLVAGCAPPTPADGTPAATARGTTLQGTPRGTSRPSGAATTDSASAVPSGSAPVPTTIDALPDWLAEAWRSGADLATVEGRLQDAGWMATPEQAKAFLPEWGDTAALRQVADLDGDGADEWVLTIITGSGGHTPTGLIGELWVINGSGQVYRLHGGEISPFWSPPVAIAQADLTGDERPEIVTEALGCGASTCLGLFHVLSGHRGGVENVLLVGTTLERAAAPYRAIGVGADPLPGWSTPGVSITTPKPSIADHTGDGLPDLVLRGGTFAAAGAGLVPARQEVWAWDGDIVSLADIDYAWEQSGERFHVLYQANLEFSLGHAAEAQARYQQVIEDDTLAEGVGLASEGENRAAARQYAAFRLALLALQDGRAEEANRWAEWLARVHPRAPITGAAAVLLENWATPDDPAPACAAVVAYLQDFENVTGPLQDAGYGNQSLTTGTLCPYG